MPNLLFIDDDVEILNVNNKFFSKQGYTVKTAATALDGVNILKRFAPDCIILDVMMPNINGFDACKRIRNLSAAPIIFLSGVTNEDERINGLMIGADDYIIKPYSFKELSARIQVQLRRNAKPNTTSVIEVPPFKIDLASHKAFFNGEELRLSIQELTLLNMLLSSPNQIITFEKIGFAIWEYYSAAERQTIMVIASRLRKKLREISGKDNLIETVRSIGYKLIAKRG